jgi:hypothetical protein
MKNGGSFHPKPRSSRVAVEKGPAEPSLGGEQSHEKRQRGGRGAKLLAMKKLKNG